MSGLKSYLKGMAAEDIVARAYERCGFDVVERRWKTHEGEVDIVARHKDKIYFIEVKNSRSFDQAALRITSRQQIRIQNAALRYLAEKANTIDVDCRFDAALVDGSGRVKVLPNAFMCN